MKNLVPLILLLAMHTGLGARDDSKFLTLAALTLPSEYFGGIPLEDRPEMLTILSENLRSSRLDYANHWLSWSLESDFEKGGVRAESSVVLKLLPRARQSPLVFVSVGNATSLKFDCRTFLLIRKKGEWIDVTEELMPVEIREATWCNPSPDFHGLFVYGPNLKIKSKPGPLKHVVIWKDGGFEVKEPFACNTDCTTDEPFNPSELAALILEPEKSPRRLMWLIIYAGLEKDERFRYALENERLKEDPSLALALASYEYALDRNDAPLDYIISVMKEEGGGDTSSLFVISYMDEWDQTLSILKNWKGDGAVGEAMSMFYVIRKFLYPGQFSRHME